MLLAIVLLYVILTERAVKALMAVYVFLYKESMFHAILCIAMSLLQLDIKAGIKYSHRSEFKLELMPSNRLHLLIF